MARMSLGWVLGLLLLTGCGVTPGPMVDDGRHLKDLHVPLASAPMDDQALVRRILAEVSGLRATTRNLSFDLTGYFINQDTGRAGSSQAHIVFEQPNMTAVTLNQSSDTRTEGTRLVWTGGKQLAVKTRFLGFWIKTSIDVHDSRARDLRGYYLDQTSIPATLDTLTDPRNIVKLVGIGNLAGAQVAQLDVVSPRSLPGIKHEIFVIDAATKLPVVREMYDHADRLVFRIRMDHMVLNSHLDPATFRLD